MNSKPLQLSPLKNNDMLLLHCYMLKGDFPDVPKDYEDALPYFEETTNFGVFKEGQLIAGLLLGDITSESAFLDVVAAPSAKGYWATPHILSQVYDFIFNKLKLDFIWVQPQSSTALKAALTAGFVFATPFDAEEDILILTKRNLPKRFRNKLEK